MDQKGVPINQIMSVTGHNHMASVKPYLKHSYDSANNALTMRNVSVSLSENEQHRK